VVSWPINMQDWIPWCPFPPHNQRPAGARVLPLSLSQGDQVPKEIGIEGTWSCSYQEPFKNLGLLDLIHIKSEACSWKATREKIELQFQRYVNRVLYRLGIFFNLLDAYMIWMFSFFRYYFSSLFVLLSFFIRNRFYPSSNSPKPFFSSGFVQHEQQAHTKRFISQSSCPLISSRAQCTLTVAAIMRIE
jgi:hypothetical protein